MPGVGELPLVMQVTFSIWQNKEAIYGVDKLTYGNQKKSPGARKGVSHLRQRDQQITGFFEEKNYRLVIFEISELLDSSPIQNFDND